MPVILLDDLYTRSTFTYAEANDRVLGDLGLRNNNMITSGDVGNWMNEAQTILARDSQAFYATFAIPTVSGTAEYAIPFDSGARAISIVTAEYKGVALFPYSLLTVYAENPRWRTAPASTPRGYWQRSFSSIGLYPAPSSSGSADLVVIAAVVPPQVTAPDDFFYIPHGCEDALIVYAKLCASIKDAYGEGKERIPFFAAEWKAAKLRVEQMVAESRGQEIISAGQIGLLRDRDYPFWWWNDPGAVATPLP